MMPAKPAPSVFTRYQVFVIALLSVLQFTVILDFVVLSPLGALLMPTLRISAAQFGLVVSAYAFSAGASGLLAAGFADKFDRKRLLLFFYAGFVVGTLLCGLAPTYPLLLGARIVTGLFGGVIGSISFAIITDLFPLEVRGRVMGFVQMSFASSQVLGIPVGLYLANRFDWHAPFLLIVAVSLLVGLAMVRYMRPVTAHLALPARGNAFVHVVGTLSRPAYLRAFAATTLLASGGFMLMPFGSAYSVHNLGIALEQLPIIYLVTGLCSMVIGPLAGRFSDQVGKFRMFALGTLLSMVVVLVYCNLGITPLWLVIAINVLLFAGITARAIPATALLSAIPDPRDRGAFMGINSSVQQLAGGLASALAGMIVVQTEGGRLGNYGLLGYVVAGAMLITLTMMYGLDAYVKKMHQPARVVQ
jgi:predicted MFS family arabinose efflux permease